MGSGSGYSWLLSFLRLRLCSRYGGGEVVTTEGEALLSISKVILTDARL